MMTTRPAVEEDLPEILDLIHTLAAFEREPDAVKNTVETLRGQLFGEHPAVFVEVAPAPAGSERRLDGMALWFLTYSTWEGTHGIYLEDLVVHDDARGRGTGTRLLKRLAQIAVEKGYARVEWAVLDWNQPAIDLYEKVGAKHQAEWLPYRLTGEALRELAR